MHANRWLYVSNWNDPKDGFHLPNEFESMLLAALNLISIFRLPWINEFQLIKIFQHNYFDPSFDHFLSYNFSLSSICVALCGTVAIDVAPSLIFGVGLSKRILYELYVNEYIEWMRLTCQEYGPFQRMASFCSVWNLHVDDLPC